MKNFDVFGVMLDVSRNGVMRVSEVKKYIDVISKMGYNALELYSEDIYKIDGEPYFGYLRGGYTPDEIRETDSYAKERGVELIPCIQTLAHFTCLKTEPMYESLFDIDDVLMIDDDATYAFLEKIFKGLSETFTSRKVNIGMDEAYSVGLGKYLRKYGYKDRAETLARHLSRVVGIAEKYGFTCHMWSDMFFRLSGNGKYFDENGESKPIPDRIRDLIPENVALTYWDYTNCSSKAYDNILGLHKDLGREVWFAGGAWAWRGFSPNNAYSLKTMLPGIKSAVKNGVRNVLITVWGDDGKDCSFSAVLPSLYAISRFAEGQYKTKDIKAGFYDLFGIKYDDFISLDLPGLMKLGGKFTGEWNCYTKNLFYNDCFLGFLDNGIKTYDRLPFSAYARKFRRIAKTAGEYAYLFDEAAKLSDFLEVKSYLGIETREAYKSEDKQKLSEVVKKYALAEKKLVAFTDSFRKLWFMENKPHGWEVQEARLGGLRARIADCKRRLEDYLDGKTDRIEELEEEILPFGYRDRLYYNRYRETITRGNM